MEVSKIANCRVGVSLRYHHHLWAPVHIWLLCSYPASCSWPGKAVESAPGHWAPAPM